MDPVTPSPKVTDAESLARLLWKVMEGLRESGYSGAAVFDLATSLAGLLILRWAAFMEAEQEAIAAFDDRVFEPTLPPALRQAAWADQTIITRLPEALRALEPRHDHARAKYVSIVAPLLQSSRMHGGVLAQLIRWVAQLKFEASKGRDEAAAAFEEFLSSVLEREGRWWGQFTTPRRVAELMVELVEPRPGDRVYDPCFGAGGLLVEAARRMRRAVLTEEPQRWEEVHSNGLFGVELNRASYLIGLCRVLLTGIDHPGLELGDALERPLPRNQAAEGFDCILAAPPWGGRSPNALSKHYPIPTRDLANLFLQHVMAHLKPGGRAVIALAEGTLFHTGADQQVRKVLLEEFRVDGVISLPPGAFAPYTGIPSSLVVIRRDMPRADVRFVQVSPKAWGPGGVEGEEGSGLLRDVSEVVKHDKDLPFEELHQGVDMWSVPISKLAKRNFELLAKRTGADALKDSLERLAASDPHFRLAPLRDVATIFGGVSYDRASTTSRPGPRAVGLLRVGDVAFTGVKAPAMFLTSEAAEKVPPERHVRSGDVMITVSGTVGRVGMVSDEVGTIGAVPANSIVTVRSRGEVHPTFLASLLQSPAYQQWFIGHARGATIRHLSINATRQLTIPVPPIPIQDAVLRNLSPGGDALSVLLRVMTGGTADPLTTWLERPLVAAMLSDKESSSDPAKVLSTLAVELLQLRPLRNRVAHGDLGNIQPVLASWVLFAVELGGLLDGIDAIPDGAPRLAALELAKTRFLVAKHLLKEEGSPLAHRLLALTSVLERLAERATQPLLGPIELRLRPSPSEIPVGIPSEVRLQLHNASSMPLRRLEISTLPDVGHGVTGYLPGGETASIPLTVQALDAGDTFKLTVRWTGVRLDGGPVRGAQTLELLVRTTREGVLARDLGSSPYIVGNPVDREEMFYGRKDVLERIQRQLGSALNANVILLEGNRRTGKTSILKQLRKPDVLPGWIPVYCSFQDAEGDEAQAGIPTRNVYRLMARTLGWSLFDAGVRTWLPDAPPADPQRHFKVEFRKALDQAFQGDHPFEVFEEYLASAITAARPRRVLFMLDEFDKLQEGIEAGITSPQVPENIRHIFQHHEGLSAILTGSRRLKRLREEYWSALFGLGYRLGISELPLEDARRLVTEPVAGRLSYLPTARDRLVELCAQQPFLIQSLCNRVFARAAESGDRTVTVAAVDEAAHEMVRDNEHFRTLWDYARTHRRRLLLALCERLTNEPDAVTLELLSTKLEAHGIRVWRESQLGDDLEYLRELELLELDKSYRGGTYRIAVPLLGRWISASIDFDDAVARAREEAQEEHP